MHIIINFRWQLQIKLVILYNQKNQKQITLQTIME